MFYKRDEQLCCDEKLYPRDPNVDCCDRQLIDTRASDCVDGNVVHNDEKGMDINTQV